MIAQLTIEVLYKDRALFCDGPYCLDCKASFPVNSE